MRTATVFNNNNNNNNKRALVVRQYTKMSSSTVQPIINIQ